MLKVWGNLSPMVKLEIVNKLERLKVPSNILVKLLDK